MVWRHFEDIELQNDDIYVMCILCKESIVKRKTFRVVVGWHTWHEKPP